MRGLDISDSIDAVSVPILYDHSKRNDTPYIIVIAYSNNAQNRLFSFFLSVGRTNLSLEHKTITSVARNIEPNWPLRSRSD